jgi:hypothetical protein
MIPISRLGVSTGPFKTGIYRRGLLGGLAIKATTPKNCTDIKQFLNHDYASH